MTSIATECDDLKEEYDNCFNAWYAKYLNGETSKNCDPIFKKYKACVWKHIKERKIDVLIQDAQRDTPILDEAPK